MIPRRSQTAFTPHRISGVEEDHSSLSYHLGRIPIHHQCRVLVDPCTEREGLRTQNCDQQPGPPAPGQGVLVD